MCFKFIFLKFTAGITDEFLSRKLMCLLLMNLTLVQRRSKRISQTIPHGIIAASFFH